MFESTKTLEQLTFKTEGVVMLRPCVDVVAYWRGSVFDRVPGIVAFYQKALELVGSTLAYYQTDTIAVPRPLRKDTLDLLPFWLAKTKSRRDVYVLQLESGTSPDEVSDRAISFQATECGPDESSGFVRLILPPPDGDGAGEALLALTKALCRDLSLDFGQAGYALNWNEFGRFPERVTETMAALRKRYPGLDLSDPGSSQYVEAGSIKCVNWLTLLGPTALDRLGGFEALQSRAADGVELHRLPSCAIVQAGGAPEIGDVNRRRTLPAYHAAGRLLASLRDPEHPAFLTIDGVDDDEATEEWLGRFDR